MARLRDDSARATRAAEVVKALAHPDRLRLVAALCEREASGAELAARLKLTPAQVARHLRPLLEHRLVRPEPGEGTPRYRVAEPVLHGLVACMEDCGR
ncbi:MAG: winged helix-turn-helix transcriptional regulator [Anaeromyxobacter sp.]|nr:winged helix-turn-helix transcriptional regulator [Anaeromyxobacter sp.]MBL0275951.1 winged helix-turn-helix transcriptional regulator [Anaeromyxobacter sp.]